MRIIRANDYNRSLMLDMKRLSLPELPIIVVHNYTEGNWVNRLSFYVCVFNSLSFVI